MKSIFGKYILWPFIIGFCVLASCSNTKADDLEVIPTDDYILRKNTFDKLPGWKFRCKVLAEKETVRTYGGRIEFMKKVDKLFEDASSYFQVPGINDSGNNQLHFFMIEMVEFEGMSKTYMYDTSGEQDQTYDIRIIINGFPKPDDVSGGWLPAPRLAIGHDFDGLFEGYAIDALVHELGHSRGMIDLYATQVTEPGNNPINGQIYRAGRGIMNYPYGETIWQEYSKLLLNASSNRRIAFHHYHFFPAGYKVKVIDPAGTVVTDCHLRFYPVYPYSNRVTETPLYEGAPSVTGFFNFPQNPFINRGSTDPNNNIYNFLVEVTHSGKKTYTWMPIQDAELAGVKGTETYVFEIRIE